MECQVKHSARDVVAEDEPEQHVQVPGVQGDVAGAVCGDLGHGGERVGAGHAALAEHPAPALLVPLVTDNEDCLEDSLANVVAQTEDSV